MATIKSFSKTDKSLTVVVSDNNTNKVFRITDTQPGWTKALSCLKSNDVNGLVESCNVGLAIENKTEGAFEIKDGSVYYRGKILAGLDITRLKEYIRDGIPHLCLERFLMRKFLNPSYRSISELYKFLEHREMTLTERGTVIGYKGVRNDYYSVNANKETVIISGTVDSDGRILNKVGEKIRCERSSVCDDYKQGCGAGLHIGSLNYAKGWGNKVMIVEFDPADVVSVPDDCDFQKLRVCAYEVIGEFDGVLVRETVKEQNAGVVEHEDDSSDEADDSGLTYRNGYNDGVKDGKAHKAREYYETDLDDESVTDIEIEYIKGYNSGYRFGRYGKK